MTDDSLHNLVWNALHTVHANFTVGNSLAARYPADVVPYAALADPRHADLSALKPLLIPNELVYLIGPRPAPTNNLHLGPPLNCFQMLFPEQTTADSSAHDPSILRMTPKDAPSMVALTDLAFPGFFRPRTHEMGAYYGIRINNELVAMTGERLAVPGFREISAVCTHPSPRWQRLRHPAYESSPSRPRRRRPEIIPSRQRKELSCHLPLPTHGLQDYSLSFSLAHFPRCFERGVEFPPH